MCNLLSLARYKYRKIKGIEVLLSVKFEAISGCAKYNVTDLYRFCCRW